MTIQEKTESPEAVPPFKPGDICPLNKLHEDEQLKDIVTKSQVNHLAKNRENNGLAKVGALLKVSNKLYVIKPLFVEWFVKQKAV